MAKRKLMVLLEALDGNQVTSLRKHILSKAGKEADIVEMFELAVQFRKKTDDMDNLNAIRETYFPNSTDKALANYLSLLYNWSEEWMAISQLYDEKHKMEVLTLKWLNKNGLYHLADQSFRKTEKTFEEEKRQSLEKEEASFHLYLDVMLSNNPGSKQFTPEDYHKMVSAFYESTKIKALIIQTELQNLSRLYGFNFNTLIDELEYTLSTMPNGEGSKTMIELNTMMNQTDMDNLKILKDKLLKGKLDPNGVLHFITSSYVNQCAVKFWSKGLHKDKALIHAIVKYCLDTGFYSTNGKIPSKTFHNLVTRMTIYLSKNQINNFIDQWVNQVATKDKESTKNLALAQVAFYYKKYDDIYQYTRGNHFEDFEQKWLANGLHLVATFINRAKEREVYTNALKTSKYFIKRHKLKMSSDLYLSHNNFHDFLEKIDARKKDKINLSAYKVLLFRSWCEEVYERKK